MICGIFLQRSMRSGPEWWWKSAKWLADGFGRSERRPSRNEWMQILHGTCWAGIMLQVPAKTQKVNTFGSKSALPLRGGNWHEAGRAGVFALNLNNSRANSWATVGFRAALPPSPDKESSRAFFQRRRDKGICPLAEGIIFDSKSGTDRRFLCAAGIGTTRGGLACSPSISTTRA